MKVRVKKLDERAVIPGYAKPGDAGMDLTAISMEDKGDKIIYGTGLAVEIPEGYVGLIFPRSSIHKKKMSLSNSVGVIDSGYRGEIKFIFKTDPVAMEDIVSKEPLFYEVGDRIGQLMIIPYPQVELEEASELSDSSRGTGGFGSTGN